jgi:Cd2+/Zn2+-exporting ATPase
LIFFHPLTQANAVMSSLMNIAPQKAVIAETGEVIDVDEVKLNAVLAVKAGEVIPIDGIVVEGQCEVDEKALTGESFPVAKQKDSTVWGGTINLNGNTIPPNSLSLHWMTNMYILLTSLFFFLLAKRFWFFSGYISVKTTALFEECMVAKMAQLVEEAQNSKTKTQRLIDKCAKFYTPG